MIEKNDALKSTAVPNIIQDEVLRMYEGLEGGSSLLVDEFIEQAKDKDARADIDVSAFANCLKEYAQFTDNCEIAHTVIKTLRYVKYGEALRALQRVVKSQDLPWENFVVEHYGSSCVSLFRQYMRLSRVPNVATYAGFGKDRILSVQAAANKCGYGGKEDPIGEFLKACEYSLTQSNSELLNREVDAVVFFHKAKDTGVHVSLADILQLAKTKCDFKQNHITNMLIAQGGTDSEGDGAKKYIQNLLENDGVSTWTLDKSNSNKVPSIGKTSAELESAFDYYKSNRELIDEVNVDDLKKIINITTLFIEALEAV